MKNRLRSAGGMVLTLAVNGLLLMGLLTGLTVKPVARQSRDTTVRLIAQASSPRQAIAPSAAPKPTLPAIEPLRLSQVPVLMAAAPAETVAPEVQTRPAAVVAVAVATAAASTRPAAPEPPASVDIVIAADHQHCPQPDYPSLLRSKRIEGRVLLRVRVEADGRPSDVVVRQGSGWRLLDEAAAQSARRCLFRPARRGQAEFASWVEYPVSFALRG